MSHCQFLENSDSQAIGLAVFILPAGPYSKSRALFRSRLWNLLFPRNHSCFFLSKHISCKNRAHGPLPEESHVSSHQNRLLCLPFILLQRSQQISPFPKLQILSFPIMILFSVAFLLTLTWLLPCTSINVSFQTLSWFCSLVIALLPFPWRVFNIISASRDSSISCKPSAVFPPRFSFATQLQRNEADVVLIGLKPPIRKYNHVFPVPCKIQAGAVFPVMPLGWVWSTKLISCFPRGLSWSSLKNNVGPAFQEKWNVFSLFPFASWCAL